MLKAYCKNCKGKKHYVKFTGEAVDEVDALAIILKWMKKLLLTLINKLDKLGE